MQPLTSNIIIFLAVQCSLLALVLVVRSNFCLAALVQVMYERVDQYNGSEYIMFKNLRIRKYNRTISVLDGEFELFQDLDDSYALSLVLSYSTLGNNQFIRSPFRIPQQPFCQFLNTTYRDYREFYRNTTNFPDVGTCPMAAQLYFIRNKVLDVNLINPAFPKGLWRADILIFHDGEDYPIVTIEMYIKVTHEDVF
ncbi:uncharacterized protein LOC126571029 [Anopheles aquasalis]|uniref:uncharacterized protein LOC126571029 n=1 Tax=Anopheles aquasalis TaxID=42839 RepID=UPI00215A1325|nr:uncharacterized protein LOC126571029 [Anopheles aquasalis]